MKHAIFVDTRIDGNLNFQLNLIDPEQVLPLIGIETPAEQVKIQADEKILNHIILLFKPETVYFLVTAYDTPEQGVLKITDVKPVINKETKLVMAIPGTPFCPTPEETEAIIRMMVKSPSFGTEAALMYGKQFAEKGVAVGYETIVHPPLPATLEEALEQGETLRSYINKKYPVPRLEDTGFLIKPNDWEFCVRAVMKQQNILLTGPTGCGKTELLYHVSEAMGRQLHIQDMGTVHDAQSALLGVHRLNEQGASEFDYAPFVSHCQSGENVLLDEINRAPQSATNVLFPCLDKRRYLPVDIAGHNTERSIPVAKTTTFFATANLGSEYSGTGQIDRALMDRFWILELGYPTIEDEVRILSTRTGVKERDARTIATVAHNIREMYLSQDLTNAVSLRHTLQTAEMVVDGFSIKEAMETTFLPLFEGGVAGVSSEKDQVRAIIAAH